MKHELLMREKKTYGTPQGLLSKSQLCPSHRCEVLQSCGPSCRFPSRQNNSQFPHVILHSSTPVTRSEACSSKARLRASISASSWPKRDMFDAIHSLTCVIRARARLDRCACRSPVHFCSDTNPLAGVCCGDRLPRRARRRSSRSPGWF